MKTILVDDEAWSINQMKEELTEYKQVEIVGSFEDPREALEFAKQNEVEFALLDIEMPYMNGLELGRRLREMNPKVILIYLTGYENYLKEAILNLKADYYLLKPYDNKDIEDVVSRALSLSSRMEKRVVIRTFGGFEVYMDGELVHLVNRKAKELLALCVHMEGKHVSMEKAVDTLWEDHPYDSSVKSLYRKAVIYLNSVFRERGITDVFENGRGYCCIRRENVTCDYFDYLAGKREIDVNDESNVYLPEYVWAEGYLQKFDWN